MACKWDDPPSTFPLTTRGQNSAPLTTPASLTPRMVRVGGVFFQTGFSAEMFGGQIEAEHISKTFTLDGF